MTPPPDVDWHAALTYGTAGVLTAIGVGALARGSRMARSASRWWRRQDATADAVLGVPGDPTAPTEAGRAGQPGLVDRVAEVEATVKAHTETWKQVGYQLERNGGVHLSPAGRTEGTVADGVYEVLAQVQALAETLLEQERSREADRAGQ